jgi:ADP-ribose pyrophosphatase YjhB (NUDIX family)
MPQGGGPERGPAVGVGAVVVRGEEVLLIRRGKAPLDGRWSVPGGTVKWGERLDEAVVRETMEETGVRVVPREVLLVTEHLEGAGEGATAHYVIVDYACDYLAGEPRGASDAREAAWVAVADLARLRLPSKVGEVVARGVRQAAHDRRRGDRGRSW